MSPTRDSTAPSFSAEPHHTADLEIQESLQRLFGFSAFRPGQLDTIRATLSGRDAFAVMPTGGGKSLCYQLPARILGGTCLVISPLIALMKDQVDSANQNGLSAACLNSSLTEQELRDSFRRLVSGDLDLLYISPERFAIDSFLSTLKRAPITSVAIDEAHCVSEWGHDFRPDYLALSRIVREFPGIPVAAFTATATQRVQNDIVERLCLRNPVMVRASFNRPNLFYEVRPKLDVKNQILAFTKDRSGIQGIVYRTTRDAVEETAEFLEVHGVKARAYHAGLDDNTRRYHQDLFNNDEIEVIVATIAFGMGIDKSNIRYVVHGDLPKNMESYYQETGRAGRDGAPAHCLLLFGWGDIPRIRYFIDQVTDSRENLRLRGALNAMVDFSQGSVCRRRTILSYFGESFSDETCGACDICTGQREEIDATRHAQMLLSAVVRTGQRFGMAHVIDIVRGADTKKIRSFGHDRLPTWGVGKDFPKTYWKELAGELMRRDLLSLTDERYPLLRVSTGGADVLSGKSSVTLTRRKTSKKSSSSSHDATQALFDHLRGVRKRIAVKRGIPPYIVANDRTLLDLARVRPSNLSQLLCVQGIGERKAAQYGKVFLAAIEEFGV